MTHMIILQKFACILVITLYVLNLVVILKILSHAQKKIIMRLSIVTVEKYHAKQLQNSLTKSIYEDLNTNLEF